MTARLIVIKIVITSTSHERATHFDDDSYRTFIIPIIYIASFTPPLVKFLQVITGFNRKFTCIWILKGGEERFIKNLLR
jgi:hypothetical protein